MNHESKAQLIKENNFSLRAIRSVFPSRLSVVRDTNHRNCDTLFLAIGAFKAGDTV